MKRTLLLVTAAAVALTPLAASAAPAKPRTLTYDYTAFQAGGTTSGASFSSENGCAAIPACWDFDTKKGEKIVEISAEDASGAAVGFQVFYDDAYADNVALFCGSAEITVSPKAGHVVSVRTSLHECDGVATEGTLTATITAAK